MARKKTTPMDAPSFFVVQPESERKSATARASKKPGNSSRNSFPKIDQKELIELFHEMDFQCEKLDKNIFFVISPKELPVQVVLEKEAGIIVFTLPLLFKPGTSKTRKYEFINQQMSINPFVRMSIDEKSEGIISFEYLYAFVFDSIAFCSMYAIFKDVAHDIINIGLNDGLIEMPKFIE